MITDIFYLIFTLMYYTQKKQSCLGVSHPRLHQSIALEPLGSLQLPQTPSCNQPMCPFFSVLSPDAPHLAVSVVSLDSN